MRHHPYPPGAEPSDDDEANGRPSKTQRKKDMHSLQALGEALLELPASRRKPLNLPEILSDAIDELGRVRSHEGRRRQLQYVGKLMRGIDPQPLREAVAAYKLPSARETLALHEAERWRDRLVADDAALTEWLDAHPEQDAQTLRALIRSARKDAAAAAAQAPGQALRKGRAWRELFQLVRTGLQGEDAAPAGGDDDAEHDDD